MDIRNFADMHIHSVYSDGSYTPERIVEIARAIGVGLLSVTDHNTIEGTLLARDAALKAGLSYVTGVEIDSLLNGTVVHILCYNADLADSALLAVLDNAVAAHERMDGELLDKLIRAYPGLSRDDYAAFRHDPAQGGWKLLQYMKANGLIKRLHDGFPLYERYGVTHARAGFQTVSEVLEAVHGAGGTAVFAHPGATFPTGSLAAFEARVRDTAALGFDGIECFYPRHNGAIRRFCEALCAQRGLIVTGGSDCHGAFNHNQIGVPRIPIGSVSAERLIKERS